MAEQTGETFRAVPNGEKGKGTAPKYRLGTITERHRLQLLHLVNDGGSVGELLVMVFWGWLRCGELETASILKLPTHRFNDLSKSIQNRFSQDAARRRHEASIACGLASEKQTKRVRIVCPACKHINVLGRLDPLLCSECCQAIPKPAEPRRCPMRGRASRQTIKRITCNYLDVHQSQTATVPAKHNQTFTNSLVLPAAPMSDQALPPAGRMA